MPAKVLLVEDDNNLREIYQARLMAEGYVIVTARDGEEALGVAKAERPDLIISDVMMPRVSGFEMLDILRNTDGLKDTKVIMLTALGQADDKTRANSLGADRYLVKSQVTLEDIVKTSHELLEGTPPPAAAAPPAPSDTPITAAPTAPVTPVPVIPVAPQPAPAVISAPPVTPVAEPAVAAPAPVATPPAAAPSAAPSTAEEQAAIGAQIQQFVNSEPAVPSPAAQDDAVLASAVQDLAASSTAPAALTPQTPSAPVQPASAPTTVAPTAAPAEDTPNDNVTIANKKVIMPPSAGAPKQPIHEILAREEAAGMHGEPVVPPVPTTTFSPTAPGAAPTPPMGPVVNMPVTPAQPPAAAAPAPSAVPSPTDPNNIAI